MVQEPKYHARCLMCLYNKVWEKKTEQSNTEKMLHGIAFTQWTAHVEETRVNEDMAPVFKLAELTRLDQLGQ